MKKIAFIGLILLCAVSIARAQGLDKYFLNSTALISFYVSPGKIRSGSAFLVFKEITEGRGHTFLVTNKHLLPTEGCSKSISIRVNVRTDDGIEISEISVPVVGENRKYLPSVRLHPKDDFDIAAINITKHVNEQGIEAKWIPLSLFVTKSKLNEENITVGDEIFLLGYPDAIYDPRNVSPIVRQGIIATEPIQGYAFNERLRKKYGLPEQIDGFLIDANVFPGSSGSLVILKPQPIIFEPRKGTVLGSGAKKTAYVLGIVSGSIPITEFYQYRGEKLLLVQRMGLGIVYFAESIKETIEQFYESR